MSSLLGNNQPLFHPWEWPGVSWNEIHKETLDHTVSECPCELMWFSAGSGNVKILLNILRF